MKMENETVYKWNKALREAEDENQKSQVRELLSFY